MAAASTTAKHQVPGIVVTFAEIYGHVPTMLAEGSRLGDELALASHRLRSDMRLIERYSIVNISELPGHYDEKLVSLAKKVTTSEDLSIKLKDFLTKLSATRNNLARNITYFQGLQDTGAVFEKSILSDPEYKNDAHDSFASSTTESTIKIHDYVLKTLDILVGYRVELDNLEDRLNVANGKTVYGYSTSSSESRSIAQPILDAAQTSQQPEAESNWFTKLFGYLNPPRASHQSDQLDLASMQIEDDASDTTTSVTSKQTPCALKTDHLAYVFRIAASKGTVLPVLEKIEKNESFEDAEMIEAIKVVATYLRSKLTADMTVVHLKSKVKPAQASELDAHLKYIFGSSDGSLKIHDLLEPLSTNPDTIYSRMGDTAKKVTLLKRLSNLTYMVVKAYTPEVAGSY